ncbi:unnamed protein product [Cuscuta epithymum]|uniref:Uncharacterized protein n=1 Tax=Cuscuta epithymum TaxID=186058 RepID=A0AAV0DHW9_9ASTE|nr:unnamed protein product [Cuscuta epithymum]
MHSARAKSGRCGAFCRCGLMADAVHGPIRPSGSPGVLPGPVRFLADADPLAEGGHVGVLLVIVDLSMWAMGSRPIYSIRSPPLSELRRSRSEREYLFLSGWPLRELRVLGGRRGSALILDEAASLFEGDEALSGICGLDAGRCVPCESVFEDEAMHFFFS